MLLCNFNSWIVVTFVFFQRAGIVPVDIDLLMIKESGLEIISAVSFRRFDGSSLIPNDLLPRAVLNNYKLLTV